MHLLSYPADTTRISCKYVISVNMCAETLHFDHILVVSDGFAEYAFNLLAVSDGTVYL